MDTQQIITRFNTCHPVYRNQKPIFELRYYTEKTKRGRKPNIENIRLAGVVYPDGQQYLLHVRGKNQGGETLSVDIFNAGETTMLDILDPDPSDNRHWITTIFVGVGYPAGSGKKQYWSQGSPDCDSPIEVAARLFKKRLWA